MRVIPASFTRPPLLASGAFLRCLVVCEPRAIAAPVVSLSQYFSRAVSRRGGGQRRKEQNALPAQFFAYTYDHSRKRGRGEDQGVPRVSVHCLVTFSDVLFCYHGVSLVG
eukprot:3239190-Pyramimonas_sp.AAC.1